MCWLFGFAVMISETDFDFQEGNWKETVNETGFQLKVRIFV